MSDDSVAKALRSDARLVVVEAPAGCGKTFQGAKYASEALKTSSAGRVLVLTHTHAACDVFAKGAHARVEIRTLDSLIAQLTGAYHGALGLPADPASWARQVGNDGYKKLASKAALLLRTNSMIGRTIASRYPIIILDEHQDSSADQESLILSIHDAGSLLRVFGDPMQRIYSDTASRQADEARWTALSARADAFAELDYPHRWDRGNKELGKWVLTQRAALKDGGQVDLQSALPDGVTVVFADNVAQSRAAYSLSASQRRPIDDRISMTGSMLILSAHNLTVRALRPFFNRRVPIWEGHTRDALSKLVASVQSANRDANVVAKAMTDFIGETSVGLSASSFGNQLESEVRSGCITNRRGKPAFIQSVARCIVREPDHRGISRALKRIAELVSTENAFSDVKIDHPREFNEACRLGDYEECADGFAEITRRRTFARRPLPAKSLSTIHKSKGLECEHVVIIPGDTRHFGDTERARCLLYVAMSRATHSLTLVLPSSGHSPLFLI